MGKLPELHGIMKSALKFNIKNKSWFCTDCIH